jgi:hypothetical protein
VPPVRRLIADSGYDLRDNLANQGTEPVMAS